MEVPQQQPIKNNQPQEQKRRGGGPRRRERSAAPADEFEQVIVDLARVTRVVSGGKRMSFRACLVLGDRKGRVGYGVAKGQDVSMAVAKATTQARKAMIRVPLVDNRTIPHEVLVKYKAARLFLKPATDGTGLKAGGAVRRVLELSGIVDIISKMHGSKNKINNVRATFLAIQQLRARPAQKKSK